MRLLICGARDWADRAAIEREVAALYDVTVIIEGEAPGADTLARKIGESMGLDIDPYPADWKRYGRAAGPIRNTQMLTEGKPDLVLAFHHDLESSKGTKNMVNQARAAGIPVRVVS